MLPLPISRPLQSALFVSLALHALLLTLLPTEAVQLKNTRLPNTSPLIATVSSLDLTQLTPPPATTVRAPSRPALLTPSKTVSALTQSTPTTPTSLPPPLNTSSAKETDRQESGGAAKSTRNSHEVSSNPTTPPAEGLSAYRLALGREAGRLKMEYDRKYTRLEQEWRAGAEGRVEMNIHMTSAGPSVSLTRSSGYPRLDEQAMALIEHAVRQTALPDSLRGHSFLLPVALEFEISPE